MRTLAEDTSPEAERVLIELFRKASSQEKFRALADATLFMRELAMNGIRERYPNDPPEVQRRRLADLLLGPELARKAYGPIPE
jgi:hypothetical protein